MRNVKQLEASDGLDLSRSWLDDESYSEGRSRVIECIQGENVTRGLSKKYVEI